MATGKRFYWIKLKDTFMTSDAVDFLMGRKDGANYVVLYQMLCLKTANTEGRLERRIGEVIIPYDVEKIARDSKWFSVDTVRVALELYKALGLVYVDENGCLIMANHKEMVGSETDYALQKRLQRDVKLIEAVDNVHTDVHENVHTDIRDKISENRDKSIEIKEKSTGFKKPELAEVKQFISDMGYKVDAEEFIAYYESNGWKVGKNPMKSWKSAVVTWQKRRENDKPAKDSNVNQTYNTLSKDQLQALKAGKRI